MVYDETQSRAADEVGELFEREWSKDFVFDFDKLWDLETHILI